MVMPVVGRRQHAFMGFGRASFHVGRFSSDGLNVVATWISLIGVLIRGCIDGDLLLAGATVVLNGLATSRMTGRFA